MTIILHNEAKRLSGINERLIIVSPDETNLTCIFVLYSAIHSIVTVLKCYHGQGCCLYIRIKILHRENTIDTANINACYFKWLFLLKNLQ